MKSTPQRSLSVPHTTALHHPMPERRWQAAFRTRDTSKSPTRRMACPSNIVIEPMRFSASILTSPKRHSRRASRSTVLQLDRKRLESPEDDVPVPFHAVRLQF